MPFAAAWCRSSAFTRLRPFRPAGLLINFPCAMTMMVLDDTPRWVAYLLTACCLAGFVWAIIDLVPRRRLSSELPGSLWSIRRKNYSLLLLLCIGRMSCREFDGKCNAKAGRFCGRALFRTDRPTSLRESCKSLMVRDYAWDTSGQESEFRIRKTLPTP